MDPSTKPKIKSVNSADLFNQSKEIIIIHNGDEYRLKITKSGKLILNK